MPSWDALTDKGREILGDYPAIKQGDPDVRALAHVFAKESERMTEKARSVRDNLIPARADELGLPWWETLLGLEVEPVALDVDQRRAQVLSWLGRAIPDPSGITWRARLTERIGPVWSMAVTGTFQRQVTVPFAPGSPTFLLAQRLLGTGDDSLGPAHIEFTVISAGGLVWDTGHWDTDHWDGS